MVLHLDAPLKAPAIIEVEGEMDPGADLFDDQPEPQAMASLPRSNRGASAFGRFAVWVFGTLFALVLGVQAWRFVSGLLASAPWLGAAAMGLVALAFGVTLVQAVREGLAFVRLGQLDSLRQAALRAHAAADLAQARAVVARLDRLYAPRPEMAVVRAGLAQTQGDVFDADSLLRLAEQALILPLDLRARAEVESATRQVALVTALIPLALADVAAALLANLRMIRRLAEIYGGRAGTLGSWRLMRRVFVSLMATGAMAMTDDLIGSFAGGGLLARLSRRFGEGVVNGALTARVGLAAMEICRPLPFVVAQRPGVTATVAQALTGLVSRKTADDPA